MVTALAPLVVALVFGGIATYGARTGKLPVRAGRLMERKKEPNAFAFALASYTMLSLFCLYVSLRLALQV